MIRWINSSPSDRAGVLRKALVAERAPRPRVAQPEDADAAEGVVVAHGVHGVEPSQGVGDLPRGPPVRRLAARQAQAPGHQVDVSVRRDHEPARRDPRPEPEVEPVPPHHPAQVEVPALAGGPAGRVWKEEPRWRGLGDRSLTEDGSVVEPVEPGDHPGEKWPDIAVLGTKLGLEESSERACVRPGARDGEEEDRSIAGSVEAVPESCEGVVREPPEIGDPVERRGRRRAEHREEAPDVRLDRLDAAIGKRGGDPADDLEILGAVIPAEENDRVGLHGLGPVGPVEALEAVAEEPVLRGEIHGAIVGESDFRESFNG